MGGKDGGRIWDGCEMVGVEQESEMGEPNGAGAGAGEQGVESQDRARVKGELRVRLRAGSGNRVKP